MMRSEIQNDAAEARENDEEELLVCFQNQKGPCAVFVVF
jgi:hypothetical protein